MSFSSVYTMSAIEIIEELEKASSSQLHFITVRASDNPKQTAKMVRMLSKDREWRERLVVAVEGSMVFSKLKEITRAEKLQAMLERVLPLIDDENVYDEIMYVLYGGSDGDGQK